MSLKRQYVSEVSKKKKEVGRRRKKKEKGRRKKGRWQLSLPLTKKGSAIIGFTSKVTGRPLSTVNEEDGRRPHCCLGTVVV